jgi:hypothetical protein
MTARERVADGFGVGVSGIMVAHDLGVFDPGDVGSPGIC